MRDDKGFSLIELIVIMAIMGVVITFGVVKSEVIFSYNAQETYKKVMSALATEKTQVLAHSTLASAPSVHDGATGGSGGVNAAVKGNGVYIKFYKDGNSIYTNTYVKGEPKYTEGKKVAGKGVTMIFKMRVGSSLVDVPISENSGASLDTDGTDWGICFSYDRSTGAFLPYKDGNYIEEIHVIGGNREYVIRLMKKTGKAVQHGK